MGGWLCVTLGCAIRIEQMECSLNFLSQAFDDVDLARAWRFARCELRVFTCLFVPFSYNSRHCTHTYVGKTVLAALKP